MHSDTMEGRIQASVTKRAADWVRVNRPVVYQQILSEEREVLKVKERIRMRNRRKTSQKNLTL